MSDTTTREQQLAERIAELRAKHPMLGDSYWEGVGREQVLQWQVDDLTRGVAELAGRYGYHAEQNPDNVLLAQLVADLLALVGVSADGGEKACGPNCDRKPEHPGLCMRRCTKTLGCTDPEGHRGRCTQGTFNGIGWADGGEKKS